MLWITVIKLEITYWIVTNIKSNLADIAQLNHNHQI